MTEYNLALGLAFNAHRGQFRNDGKTRYVDHPIAVAESLSDHSEDIQIIALLHDVAEDSDTNLDVLEIYFGKDVRDAIDAISRRDSEAYVDYINRVALNPDATIVKIADIEHNSLTATPSMLKRYAKALDILKGKLASTGRE
jgi:GTP diphosphokinase / guanosine-3',5'-bis(diphosphate) 3'-diphosphatase